MTCRTSRSASPRSPTSTSGGARVGLDDGEWLCYDRLVLAAGSSTADFGIPGVAEHAFALKTLPDAIRLRNHLLTTFERAGSDPALRGDPAATTVVLAGGGPTGVELAGALAELVHADLAPEVRDADLGSSRIVVVEMTGHLLAGFSPAAQEAARRALSERGVEVLLNSRLARVGPRGVVLDDGRVLEARTVIWTAGVRPNPLAAAVPGAHGPGGAVLVEPDLSLPGHPEVFAIGDIAARRDADQPLPLLAQVATKEGRHVARAIRRDLAGRPTRPFRYRSRGIMATIGRRSAIAELPGGIRLTGSIGWFVWLFVHLVFLVGLRNRVVVLVKWGWYYFRADRGARVILDDTARAAAPPTAP